jgi:hypothetical protein
VNSGEGTAGVELFIQLEFLEGLDVVTTSGKRLGDKYDGRRLLHWRHRHRSVGKACKCQRQNDGFRDRDIRSGFICMEVWVDQE